MDPGRPGVPEGMNRRKAFAAIGFGLASPLLNAALHLAGDAAAGECMILDKPEHEPTKTEFFFDDGSQSGFTDNPSQATYTPVSKTFKVSD